MLLFLVDIYLCWDFVSAANLCWIKRDAHRVNFMHVNLTFKKIDVNLVQRKFFSRCQRALLISSNKVFSFDAGYP